jgi:cytochrome c-type biogenesis protein
MQPVVQLSSSVGAKAESFGAVGFILTGAILELFWTPCSGPTLGVAFTLAAKDDSMLRASGLLALLELEPPSYFLLCRMGRRIFSPQAASS